MASFDYFVGFEREPEGLEEFLKEQGYDPTQNGEDKSVKNFESRDGGLVDIFYLQKVEEAEEGEFPDWKKSGHDVISELFISTKDFEGANKAELIAYETAKKYEGILGDPQCEEYTSGDDIEDPRPFQI